MTEFDKAHIIHSEGDGVLGETNRLDVEALVDAAKATDHIVIHLHGGLVKHKSGLDMAARLTGYYENHALYPVFFVWETGLLETVKNNLGQIVLEDVFQQILSKILKWIGGKANAARGVKSFSGLTFPNDIEVDNAVKYVVRDKSEDSWEPDFEVLSQLAQAEQEFSSKEIDQFERELRSDKELNKALKAVSLGMKETPKTDGTKSFIRSSETTLMSPDVVAEIRGDEEGEKAGFLSWGVMIRRITRILKRALARFVRGRGHGRYTTIVEEILYELYIVNVPKIGQIVWSSMKKDAQETFENNTANEPKAGLVFWDSFASALLKNPNLKVSIVAHSAGAIYACHMLAHVGHLRALAKLPERFQFENVIFLAPAVKSELLAETLREHGELVGAFRMFTLTDAAERGYWEFPGYLGSLLYMVSGLFEPGDKYHDVGVAGMMRYVENEKTYQAQHFQELREFLNKDERTILSPNEETKLGKAADSIKHGAFDQTGSGQKTMQSVVEILMRQESAS